MELMEIYNQHITASDSELWLGILNVSNRVQRYVICLLRLWRYDVYLGFEESIGRDDRL